MSLAQAIPVSAPLSPERIVGIGSGQGLECLSGTALEHGGIGVSVACHIGVDFGQGPSRIQSSPVIARVSGQEVLEIESVKPAQLVASGLENGEDRVGLGPAPHIPVAGTEKGDWSREGRIQSISLVQVGESPRVVLWS